ncbi:MAG: hypothetical protein WC389_21030 [Lutibacter sp.]|jgi:hypothetical protein
MEKINYERDDLKIQSQKIIENIRKYAKDNKWLIVKDDEDRSFTCLTPIGNVLSVYLDDEGNINIDNSVGDFKIE